MNHTSVDHYLPKSRYPAEAYEWSNLRLCRARLNHNKGSFEDVLDPFQVQSDWFTLEFTTFLIVPSNGVSAGIAADVRATIERLQLNTDDDYVNERVAVVREYCLEKVSLSALRTRYPFIAAQMETQDFDRVFKDRFAHLFSIGVL